MRRIERLLQRRIDDSLQVRASMINEGYKDITESESVKYTIGAMQPIDPDYTANTFAQGNRVKNQLDERLSTGCVYEYQGSTVTDTHVKARSDIDLLAIRTDWSWYEGSPPNPYRGDPVADMHALRTDAEKELGEAFPEANVVCDKPKAICVSGGSLRRVVDVVPAAWYETADYIRTGDRTLRGVKVFDKTTGLSYPNLPFLHKKRIEERDQETRGGLRKATRLMKSLVYDAEERCTISSYNVAGIAYNIPDLGAISQMPRPLAILDACCRFCESLLADAALRAAIRVPDGHRGVFGDAPGASSEQLTSLTKELSDLRRDVLNENVRVFTKLAEARVDFPRQGGFVRPF